MSDPKALFLALTRFGHGPHGYGDIAVAATDPRGVLKAEFESPLCLSTAGIRTRTKAEATGRLTQLLGGLDGTFEELEKGLGAKSNRTAVVAITEFDRTARINGTTGTDHGTASVAFPAGGTIAGGRVRRLAGPEARPAPPESRSSADDGFAQRIEGPPCRSAAPLEQRSRRTGLPAFRRSQADARGRSVNPGFSHKTSSA
ncbi:MAG: DUF1501 domain-containing protein [Beijerinckiaceae bacterium]